ANPALWFLQHGLWELVGEPRLDEAWESYRCVNERIAEAVCEELAADADRPVGFHDYHLYVAPSLVRRDHPRARLAHFVHIPGPGAEAGAVLADAMARAIHEGLLANDVVGFHTHRWRDNFLASVEAVLGADVDVETGVVEHAGRSVLVTAHPISVDTDEFDE